MCLIFSVLSTIDQYSNFANETLFWMVSSLCSLLSAIMYSPTGQDIKIDPSLGRIMSIILFKEVL